LWVRLRAYPGVEHLKALPANTRLGWKGLPWTNTPAYNGNPQITAVISFMIQAPGAEGGTQTLNLDYVSSILPL
jgi:hypothetical protein